MTRNFPLCILSGLFILSLAVSPAFSGGPLIIFDSATRTPLAYKAFPVSVFTDLGPMGPLTNLEADVLTGNGFAEWSGVPS